ncbi:MAG: hypothetical protein NE327_21990 [Lentisphaeraceae bacterium]|nr:hypothetical protein [Lentisphaeraceae bacterium]
MNKKHLKYFSLIAILVYVWLIWPKDSIEDIGKPESSSIDKGELSIIQNTTSRPDTKQKQSFKPKVVKAPDSADKKKEFFRVTAPEAIAYAENDQLAIEKGPGKTPPITEDQIAESQQLQSVIEATKDPKKLGSRLSPLVKAAPFDKQRFLNDESYKLEYLSTAEPGRVYQTDSESEYKITRVSPYYQEVVQGESVTISVKAQPMMPVSIASFDLGKFANHLTYQTVLADSSGVATFEFFGMEGTFNDANLLVSGVTSRGQVKFVVHTKIKTETQN